jgi:hypothetical protein
MPRTQTPAPASTTDETVAVNVPLPIELHRRLKSVAATRGLSVKAAVVAAVDAWAS